MALTPFSLAQTVRHTALQTLAGAGLQKSEAEGAPTLSGARGCCLLLWVPVCLLLLAAKIVMSKPCLRVEDPLPFIRQLPGTLQQDREAGLCWSCATFCTHSHRK